LSALALDTSVAIPFLMRSHRSHEFVRRSLNGESVVLTGHSLVECYSVLTRLPGDARVDPADAARLIEANFGDPALVDPEQAAALPGILVAHGISGGAVYDAVVGLAALSSGLTLATRDGRARPTYDALGVELRVIAGEPGQ